MINLVLIGWPSAETILFYQTVSQSVSQTLAKWSGCGILSFESERKSFPYRFNSFDFKMEFKNTVVDHV